MPNRTAVLLVVLLLSGCRSPAPVRVAAAADAPPKTTTLPPPEPSEADNPVTKVEMHNVLVHEDALLTLRIRWLRGAILPGRPNVIPSFDDKSSMLFEIEAGVVSVSASDITSLLNRKVLAYPGSPLTKVSFTTQGNQVKLTGTLHKGISFPIQMVANVGASSDGNVLLHPVKLSALHVPVKGLLASLGIHVSDLLDAKVAKGITVQGDDIVLNMDEMMPPPKKRGHITAVHVRGNDLVEIYGSPNAEVVHARQWKNFISCQGGALRFGKLTMQKADMIMIDTGSAPWFDFFLDHYQEQLRAGYIKTTPTQGIQIFMQDYNQLPREAGPKENR